MVQLTASIIEEHARRESLVVIGRGAPVLLKERRDVFRVFVAGSVDGRVARICRRTGVSRDDALREIKKSDQHRAAYMQTYNHTDWRDPGNYDLVVNTDRLGVEVTADIIVHATRPPVT